MNKIDSLDKRIAQLLAKDAQQNHKTLSKQLNVSSATVRRRIKKLMNSDLLRIIGVVDPNKFGFPLTVLIALDIVPNQLISTVEKLIKMPEIRWASKTTGRFDIIAMARFSSTETFSQFLSNELSKLKGLRDSETFMCLDVDKQYMPFIQ
jgi:DNA-binding Lrp family transcriptional regulator